MCRWATVMLAFAALGAGDACKGSTDEVMNAEFRTLTACLEGIKRNSGSLSLKIVTDTPSEVSGFLENGKSFACEEVSSGTKGVYFKGWYFVGKSG